MTTHPTTTHRDPRLAFERAIAHSRLSDDPASPVYAGQYMYMFTDENGRDQFKNIDTRRYDV